MNTEKIANTPSGPQILIVEDRRYENERLDAAGSELGYRIAGIANTVAGALELAKRTSPDLALVNMDLQSEDHGFVVARELRERQIPVIFLSSSSSQSTLLRACSSGCFGYLVKPLRPNELDAAIRIALEQHGSAFKAFARHSWLTTLLDSISDGVIATGEAGVVSFLNPAAQVLTGWTPLEAIGKHIEEVFPLLHFETMEQMRKGPVHTALDSGAPTGKQRFLLSHRTGVHIPIEGSTAPVLDGTALAGTVTIFVNISGRIASEKAKSREQDRLREEIDASHLALARGNEDLLALTGRLIDGQEEERRRIARELHDDLAQRAALISHHVGHIASGSGSLSAKTVGDIEQLKAMIDDLVAGLREVSHRLHPSIIADLGLPAALDSLIRNFRSRGLDVTLSVRNLPAVIPVPLATAYYRIAQEALRNTVKHAPGAPARVSVLSKGDELQMRIEDAGPGFSLVHSTSRFGLGLLSMEERARNVGGSVLLKTKPGEGTAVLVSAPLPPPNESQTNSARRGSSADV